MASRAIKNFVAGFAGATLDSIQKREAYDRDLQKAKMLQQLQSEQAKELADYEELLARKKPSKDLSSTDYTTGKRKLRNAYGDDLGEMDVPASEMFEYKTEQEKNRLELANIQSQIASRSRDDARQERQTSAYIKSLDSRGTGPGGKTAAETGDLAASNELMYRYKGEVDEAVKSGNISQSAIRQAAFQIVRNSKDGESAQISFMKWLNDYRTGRKKTDQATR